MCTLIALHRCFPGVPLLIAANRDEYFDRPSESPRVRAGERLRNVSPRDLRAGGTWLGVNETGVFAAVTNRRCMNPDPSRLSRGELVTRALDAANASEAARALEALPSDAYNPFNFFVADRNEAFCATYENEAQVTSLGAGAHVVGNLPPDETDAPKIARVRAEAEAARAGTLDEARAALREICREHDTGGPHGPLDDTCVHLPSYGTRSSTLFELHDEPRNGRLLYAEGSPCRAEYDDFTVLLHELSPSARYVGEEEPTRKAS